MRLTWPELIAGRPGAAALDDPDPDDPLDWREAVALCRTHANRLTGWEIEFVANVADYQHPPTARQQRILRRLVAKLHR